MIYRSQNSMDIVMFHFVVLVATARSQSLSAGYGKFDIDFSLCVDRETLNDMQ